MKRLENDVEKQPEAYLCERAKRLGVSISCIWYALKRLLITYKKNPGASKT